LISELISIDNFLFCARNRYLIAKDALMGTTGVGNENGYDEWASLIDTGDSYHSVFQNRGGRE
jgi:hypothetical protein